MIGQKGIPATYGGVERHVEELAARLAAKGHAVTAYCRRHYTSGPTTHRGVNLEILPSFHTKHLDTLSHTVLAATHAVRREFDIIHFHAVGPASLSFMPRVFRRKSCAVVATIHALDWRRRKWGSFAKCCLRAAGWAAVHFPHRTIAVSRHMADYFRQQGRDIVHIPNGVEPAQREPIRELARFGLKGKRFVLWIGRFVPEKRVEDLIAALRRLSGDTRLLLAGEMEESAPYVQSLQQAAGGDPRIIFAGGLYGRAKAEALTHAELVVQPSEMEGFPIVLLEAMRYGRPVLASDIPEHLEAVAPGANGFVFNACDAESLRKNLAWALAHPNEIAAAGRQAESDARKYDWDRIAEQTESVYAQAHALLSRGRRKSR